MVALDIQVERGQAEALEQLAKVAWTREAPLPSAFSGESADPSTLEPIHIEPLRVPPLNIDAEDSTGTGPGA
jgi:hypothetical protein